MQNFPNPTTSTTLRRIFGSGGIAIAQIDYAQDGKPGNAICVYEVQDGKIVRETDYFADPFRHASGVGPGSSPSSRHPSGARRLAAVQLLEQVRGGLLRAHRAAQPPGILDLLLGKQPGGLQAWIGYAHEGGGG